MDEEKTLKTPSQAGKGNRGTFVLVILLVLIIFFVVVMVLASRKPAYLSLAGVDRKVKGAHFVKANQALIQKMYEHWLPNDYFWPTALLDNIPNFQIGELEVVRYNVRVLRDNLARMRTTDKLDPHVEAAFTALSNDPYKWWFPSAESRWRQGHGSLETFYQNLVGGKT